MSEEEDCGIRLFSSAAANKRTERTTEGDRDKKVNDEVGTSLEKRPRQVEVKAEEETEAKKLKTNEDDERVEESLSSKENTTTRLRKLNELGLNSWLVTQCESLGLRRPTPVQSNCIPEILAGRDVIGCAKTGSGKTAAFALPVLQKLFEDPFGVFALVLTPTRELARQIAEQFRVFGRSAGVKVVEVVGGLEMLKQAQRLVEKPHVVVATPGRLADHLESSDALCLKRIKFLVLDEADRLLDDDTDFPQQLQVIFKHLPKKRQTLLFSATMNETIDELKASALTNPFFWKAPSEVATVEQLDQRFVLVPSQVKEPNLIQIVKEFREEKPLSNCIIFTKTCRTCQILSRLLIKCGFECAALHSMMSQTNRFSALNAFKSKQKKFLVSTDVASRGLDIPTVDLVVNFDLPTQPKVYVHRVGRTARAGRGGKALTIITEHDIKLLHAIEGLVKVRLSEHKVNEKEVLANLVKINVAKKQIEVRLGKTEFGKRKESRRINRKKKRLLAEEES